MWFVITVSGLPDGIPVSGFQLMSSPALLPLTRCLPSGDHAIERTQFLCPEKIIEQYSISII